MALGAAPTAGHRFSGAGEAVSGTECGTQRDFLGMSSLVGCGMNLGVALVDCLNMFELSNIYGGGFSETMENCSLKDCNLWGGSSDTTRLNHRPVAD